MALSLVFNVETTSGSTGTSVTFTDSTGNYSASNTGGWGAPNPAKSTVTASEVVVYEPNNDTAVATIDLYISPFEFPKTETSFELTTDDVYGSDTTWVDGVYRFDFVVTTNSGGVVENETTSYYLSLVDVTCCMKQQSDLVGDGCCDGCEDKALERFTDMDELYRCASFAFADEQYVRAQNFVDKLTVMCGDDCNCN